MVILYLINFMVANSVFKTFTSHNYSPILYAVITRKEAIPELNPVRIIS